MGPSRYRTCDPSFFYFTDLTIEPIFPGGIWERTEDFSVVPNIRKDYPKPWSFIKKIFKGYSHVRLNTGSQHNTDEAASLFIRIAFT